MCLEINVSKWEDLWWGRGSRAKHEVVGLRNEGGVEFKYGWNSFVTFPVMKQLMWEGGAGARGELEILRNSNYTRCGDVVRLPLIFRNGFTYRGQSEEAMCYSGAAGLYKSNLGWDSAWKLHERCKVRICRWWYYRAVIPEAVLTFWRCEILSSEHQGSLCSLYKNVLHRHS